MPSVNRALEPPLRWIFALGAVWRTQSEGSVVRAKRLLRVAGQAALPMPPRYPARRRQYESPYCAQPGKFLGRSPWESRVPYRANGSAILPRIPNVRNAIRLPRPLQGPTFYGGMLPVTFCQWNGPPLSGTRGDSLGIRLGRSTGTYRPILLISKPVA